MNRAEAVSILKEILNDCRGTAPFMAIMSPNSNKVLSDGYQIHIKTRPTTFDKTCVQDISERNDLALKEEEELLVIYQPQKDQ